MRKWFQWRGKGNLELEVDVEVRAGQQFNCALGISIPSSQGKEGET